MMLVNRVDVSIANYDRCLKGGVAGAMDEVFWRRGREKAGLHGWLFTYMRAVGKTHLDKVRKTVTVVIVREEEVRFRGMDGRWESFHEEG